MNGKLTLGQMTAFFAYTSAFIWPFFILSFAGTFVSRAQVSWKRIEEVLNGEEEIPPNLPLSREELLQDASTDTPLRKGARGISLQGHIIFRNVTLRYGEKEILRNISF